MYWCIKVIECVKNESDDKILYWSIARFSWIWSIKIESYANQKKRKNYTRCTWTQTQNIIKDVMAIWSLIEGYDHYNTQIKLIDDSPFDIIKWWIRKMVKFIVNTCRPLDYHEGGEREWWSASDCKNRQR